MDLCTVISEAFIPQAVNLIQSYKINSYDQRVFLYHFNTNEDELNIFNELFGDQVILTKVEEVCDHALSPRVFFYKTYAINDCLNNKSDFMIYSDSANCFVSPANKIELDLIDDSLLLRYPYEKLTNKYWTTKRCLEAVESPLAEIMPQYWAGFQVYKKTSKNLDLVSEMYNLMFNPDIALPDTTVNIGRSSLSCPCWFTSTTATSLLIWKEIINMVIGKPW